MLRSNQASAPRPMAGREVNVSNVGNLSSMVNTSHVDTPWVSRSSAQVTVLELSRQFGHPPTDFKRRSFLPASQGQFWLIQSGFVRTLSYQEDGVVVAIGVWGPGDVVGRPLSKADPYFISDSCPGCPHCRRRLASPYPGGVELSTRN